MEYVKKNDLKKKPFYLSIDFEDFYYNSLRDLKCENPKTKEEALIKSYERIKYICKQYLDNKKMVLENNNFEYHYKRPLFKNE